MSHCKLPVVLAATLITAIAGYAPVGLAHGEPDSTGYDLLVPGDPMNGQITFVTLIGPDVGEEVLHTTWNLTFSSGPGGTPASEIMLELGMPTTDGWLWWTITGADLGWPAATGTYSGSLGSDQLNGVLVGGLFGFSTPDLTMGAVNGGLTGQFISSTITLELAADDCQTDLGFGGPGDVTLSLCGSLASGDMATLELAGAPSFGSVFLVAGLNSSPTPFKGGTLVPVPYALLLPLSADALGALSIPVPGGNGPLTVYLQAVVPDGHLPLGHAISNALEVQLLP